MGIYNLKEVLDGYKAGTLDKILEPFNQNDLAFIQHELEEYLKKHESSEEYKGLIDLLESRINSMD